MSQIPEMSDNLQELIMSNGLFTLLKKVLCGCWCILLPRREGMCAAVHTVLSPSPAPFKESLWEQQVDSQRQTPKRGLWFMTLCHVVTHLPFAASWSPCSPFWRGASGPACQEWECMRLAKWGCNFHKVVCLVLRGEISRKVSCLHFMIFLCYWPLKELRELDEIIITTHTLALASPTLKMILERYDFSAFT